MEEKGRLWQKGVKMEEDCEDKERPVKRGIKEKEGKDWGRAGEGRSKEE